MAPMVPRPSTVGERDTLEGDVITVCIEDGAQMASEKDPIVTVVPLLGGFCAKLCLEGR